MPNVGLWSRGTLPPVVVWESRTKPNQSPGCLTPKTQEKNRSFCHLNRQGEARVGIGGQYDED